MNERDPFGFTEEEWNEMERMFKEKLEKAMKEDPFYMPKKDAKKAKKETKEKKEFESYNWTTMEKIRRGLRERIKELKAKTKRTDKEKNTLRRMQNLLKWHNWALKQHNAGWSDKRIHRASEAKKAKKAKEKKART